MMNWLSKVPISHRGLHSKVYPENSLGAFDQAIKSNYAIELDIRITKDGNLVVFNDLETGRVTSEKAKVSDKFLSELESLKLLGTEYKVPSLKTALKFINGAVPILIEIKNEGSAGVLEDELIIALDGYSGAFAIQSFNPLALKYISKKRPEFKVGLLVGSYKNSRVSFIKKIVLKYMLLTPYLRPDFFSVEYGVDIWMQKAMMKVYSDKDVIYWTITNKDLANELIKSGHGVIFEGFKI